MDQGFFPKVRVEACINECSHGRIEVSPLVALTFPHFSGITIISLLVVELIESG